MDAASRLAANNAKVARIVRRERRKAEALRAVDEHLAPLPTAELHYRTVQSALDVATDGRHSAWWLARYVLELHRRGTITGTDPLKDKAPPPRSE